MQQLRELANCVLTCGAGEQSLREVPVGRQRSEMSGWESMESRKGRYVAGRALNPQGVLDCESDESVFLVVNS